MKKMKLSTKTFMFIASFCMLASGCVPQKEETPLPEWSDYLASFVPIEEENANTKGTAGLQYYLGRTRSAEEAARFERKGYTRGYVVGVSAGDCGGYITVPDYFEDSLGHRFPVVAEMNKAFKKKDILSVQSSAETLIIGEEAHASSSITSYQIPASCTAILSSAFMNCNSLSSISGHTDAITTIGDHAFAYDYALSDFRMPANVTEVGDSAFKDCRLLDRVTFQTSSPLTIGKSAFEGCSSLAYLLLPMKIKEIGQYAFKGCSSMKGYFSNTQYTNDLPNYSSDSPDNHFDYLNADNEPGDTAKNLWRYDASNTGNVSYHIFDYGAGVMSETSTMDEDNIYSNYSLMPITNDNAVYSQTEESGVQYSIIYYEACDAEGNKIDPANKTALAIPSSLEDGGETYQISGIGDPQDPKRAMNVFSNYNHLAGVSFSSNLRYIGAGAFRDCNLISNLSLQEGLLYIGDNAFNPNMADGDDHATEENKNEALQSLTIPSTVKEIGAYSFAYMTVLNSLTFSGIDSDPDSSAANTTNLAKIGDGAFAYAGFDTYQVTTQKNRKNTNHLPDMPEFELVLPGTVDVGVSAFAWSNFFNSIYFDEHASANAAQSYLIIRPYAFYNVGTLTNLYIDNDGTNTYIGHMAFGWWDEMMDENDRYDYEENWVYPSIHSVFLHAHIQDLSSFSASPSTTLSSSEVAAYAALDVNQYGINVGSDWFHGRHRMVTYCEGSESSLARIDILSLFVPGDVLLMSNAYPIYYNQSRENVVTMDDASGNAMYEFLLTSASTAMLVKYVGDPTRCVSTTLTVPQAFTLDASEYTVNAIGPFAFYGNYRYAVSSDDMNAYGGSGSYAFTSLVLPYTIESIGDFAFAMCHNLSSVSSSYVSVKRVTSIQKQTRKNKRSSWENSGSPTVTTVPYQTANGADYLPENLVSMGAASFAYTALTTIRIWNNTLTFGAYPFVGCFALRQVLTQAENQTSSTSRGTESQPIDDLTQNVVTTTDYNYSAQTYTYSTSYGSSRSSATSNSDALIFNNEVVEGTIGGLSSAASVDVALPYGVTGIRAGAFRGDRSLNWVDVPSTLLTIGDYAFADIDNAAASYGVSSSSLSGGMDLTNFSIGGLYRVKDNGAASRTTNANYAVSQFSDGSYFYYSDDTSTSWYGYRASSTSSMTTIGNYAFYNCSNLKDFFFANSLTSIGDYAFYGCSSLKYSFYRGSSYWGPHIVNVVGTDEQGQETSTPVAMFYFASMSNISSIGDYAFYGSNYGGFWFPNSSNEFTIGTSAFEGSPTTQYMVFPANSKNAQSSSLSSGLKAPVTFGERSFANNASMQGLYFWLSYDPARDTSYYTTSPFTDDEEAVTSTHELASSGYVFHFDKNCFAGCTNIRLPYIPAGAYYGEGVFEGCTGMDSIFLCDTADMYFGNRNQDGSIRNVNYSDRHVDNWNWVSDANPVTTYLYTSSTNPASNTVTDMYDLGTLPSGYGYWYFDSSGVKRTYVPA